MKTILVTAFEPFGGSGRNSSLDTLRVLPEEIGGARIVKREMPVEYVRSGEALVRAAEEIGDLAAVLCLGQAEGRGNITPEYLAVNVRHASIADNAGTLCRYARIDGDGPAARFVTLPVERMVTRLAERGIPAAPSFSAGTYVCNSILYAALEPIEMLKKFEAEGDYTSRLAYLEEEKTSLPFGLVWDAYCEMQGVPGGDRWLADVKRYERDVLSAR